MRPTAPELTKPLTDPAFYTGDPFPLYARLRREAPRAWNEEPGFWVLSTYDDVMTASKDPETFCSKEGVLLMDLGRELPEIPGALLYVDPPEHQRYRQMVQPAFAPSRIRALEDVIRSRAATLLEAVEPGKPFDVVGELAVPFPLVVIADLLGVSIDDWPKFYEWSDAAIAGGTEQTDETAAALGEMAEYFLAVIADRRAAPRDDLVSTLATVEVDGEQLNDGELMMFCAQLLVAGNETTRNLVSAGLLALAEHPTEWRKLVDDRATIPTAVEELLRWTTPVISFLRTATRDTELSGEPISAGDPLMLLYASANRDEDVFGSTAGTLDVTRRDNHQLAFGFGEHYCIGAALARLEGRVMLEELLARFDTIDLSGEVTRLESAGVVAGIVHADIVLS
jgi:cytochrome P450